MPKIIRVTLTEGQRAELNERARMRTVAPRLRERLEMVRLSDLGQTVPRIARTLDAHEQTVRKYLKAFLADGFDALPDRPIPGRRPTVTRADLAAVGALLDAAAQGGRGRRPSCATGWPPSGVCMSAPGASACSCGANASAGSAPRARCALCGKIPPSGTRRTPPWSL